MKISHHSHIPDRETFETNHYDVLTDFQKKFFGNEINNICSINSSRGYFVFNATGQYYNFKNIQLDFHGSTNPFVNRNTELLPGVEYEFNYMQIPGNPNLIFLSAEATHKISPETVYETMIHDLEKTFNFKPDDLAHNKDKMFSPKQLIRHRKGLKEYDPDPTVSFQDFVFNGEKTIDSFSIDQPYAKKLLPYFSNQASIFLFNVTYRVYYEQYHNSFLSVEPIEILSVDQSEENLHTIGKPIEITKHSQSLPKNSNPSPISKGCLLTILMAVCQILLYCFISSISDYLHPVFCAFIYIYPALVILALWVRAMRKE